MPLLLFLRNTVSTSLIERCIHIHARTDRDGRSATATRQTDTFRLPLQQADVLFLSDMAKYMRNDPAAAVYPHATLSHLMWWSWNPNSGDTGGLVQDDWLTVILLFVAHNVLQALLACVPVLALFPRGLLISTVDQYSGGALLWINSSKCTNFLIRIQQLCLVWNCACTSADILASLSVLQNNL